jgi:hypothetical protein
MTELTESDFPVLYAHGTRKDWGASVLAGEHDGKRSYLFETGEERTMGGGAHDMMRKVSPLNSEQQATLARLTALVARRRGLPDPSRAAGFVLLQQLGDLHKAFPQGFADTAWQSENRAGRLRSTVAAEAQQTLSLKALDAQLKAQQFDALWAAVVAVLRSTSWVPADQFTPPPGVGLGLLAAATRELLYGSATLEQRVDRFVAAYETAFRRSPRWETATALLALVFPREYVLVDITSFRKQLKALGSKGSLPARPAGASYSRCVNIAGIVSAKLTENGEVAQDLLDVHDFIRFTLKAQSPARRAKAAKPAKAAKAPKKKAAAASGADEADDDASEAADDGD